MPKKKKTVAKTGPKGAPVRKKVDPAVVTRLAAMGLTQEEVASAVGVDRTTLWRTYRSEFEAGRLKATASIRQVQFKKAVQDENVPMLIHLGKQLCGQSDKAEIVHTHTATLVERISKARQQISEGVTVEGEVIPDT